MWPRDLEKNFNNRPSNKRRPCNLLVLLMLVLVLGTTAVYLVLGVLLLCYHIDAPPLLGLVTISSQLNKWGIIITPAASAAPFYAFSKSNTELYRKPRGVKIVAVVSYRNWKRTSILDCYLKKNLVEHGGLLDEIVFIPETTEQTQLEWLYETVNKTEIYAIKPSWYELTLANDNNNDRKHNTNLYLKIDGDVVYIEENVIPTIVNTKLHHPEVSLVSANVIHQPAVAEFHRRTMVAVPHSLNFESASLISSDATRDEQQQRSKSSLLLYWKNLFTLQWQEWQRRAGRLPGSLDDNSENMNNYSTTTTTTKPSTPSSTSLNAFQKDGWVSQAQQHISFLHHLERDDLRRYKFPLWRNPPQQISGTFVCATGSDIDDLVSLKASTLIDGKGVVSHYDSMAGLDSTDVLDRYRLYAQENIFR